jgi:hypothetical protein
MNGGLVEIVRLRGDIGHFGKHGAQLRQVPAGRRRKVGQGWTQMGHG